MRRRSSEDRLAPGMRTPVSTCWPEEDALCGGRTPAKPPWSEVMIFWEDFLRQDGSLTEDFFSQGIETLSFCLNYYKNSLTNFNFSFFVACIIQLQAEEESTLVVEVGEDPISVLQNLNKGGIINE